MLIKQSSDSIDEEVSFIKEIETGYIDSLPHLKYCIAEYDVNFYSDDLFEVLKQPVPFFLKNASIKRKAEYFAGRYCGQRLLENKPISSVIDSCQRVPLWPEGWSGSISHTENHAIAIVAHQSACILPGVDIENLNFESVLESQNVFASLEEREFLLKSKTPYSLGLLMLFSAKESLYKSIWIKVRRILEFGSAKIVGLNEVQQSFTLALTDSLASTLKSGSEFNGRYAFYKGAIITCMAITDRFSSKSGAQSCMPTEIKLINEMT